MEDIAIRLSRLKSDLLTWVTGEVPSDRASSATALLVGSANVGSLYEPCRLVRDALRADACVVWQHAEALPSTSDEGANTAGKLYPLVSSFDQEKERAIYAGLSAEVGKDQTARCYADQVPTVRVANFLTLDTRSAAHDFMSSRSLGRLCYARIPASSSESPWAVSIYRTLHNEEFTSEDENALFEAASFLRGIYKTAGERRLLGHMSEVEEILFVPPDEAQDPTTPSPHLDSQHQLQRVCELVSQLMHCREVSLFLDERRSNSRLFSLQATTYDREWINRCEYVGSNKTEGLTGYVLECGQPLLFFDLLQLKGREDLDYHWEDSAQVEQRTRDLFQLEENDPLPPLAFMACPVRSSHETLGVLRCSVSYDPFSFSREEQFWLRKVANLVGDWWDIALRLRQERHDRDRQERRADVFRARLSGSRKVNAVIHAQARDNSWDLPPMLDSAVEQFHSIAGCAWVSVRHLDGDDLVVKAVRSSPDVRPTDTGGSWGTDSRQPHQGSLASCAALEQDNLMLASDWRRNSNSAEWELFGQMPAVICTPIFAGATHWGSLDIGFRTLNDYDAAREAIEDFAAQVAGELGVYGCLLNRIKETEALKNWQLQAYRNVAHQLNSPLISASDRCRYMSSELLNVLQEDKHVALDSKHPVNVAHRDSRRILGLVRKAHRVAASIEMLGRISQGRDFTVRVARHDPGSIRKLVLESFADHFLLAAAESKLHYKLNAPILKVWASDSPYPFYDQQLLEQVVDALIGNACKYSRVGSTLEVEAGIDLGKLVLTFANRSSIPFTREDADRCTTLYWRSEDARLKDADGSGLGLWLVEHLVSNMGGTFTPEPRDNHEIIRMHIRLPLEPPNDAKHRVTI